MEIIVAVVVLAFGAGAFLVVRRQRVQKALPGGEALRALPGPRPFNPKTARIGDHAYLGDAYADIFEIVARADYRDEDGEEWTEFELFDLATDTTLYLSYELDDEDRPVFGIHRPLDAIQLESLTAFDDVVRGGTKPSRDVVFNGTAFRAPKDDYWYDATVRDVRKDRPEESRYEVKLTDYRAGDRELCLELWDGGRSITIGEPISEVTLYNA